MSGQPVAYFFERSDGKRFELFLDSNKPILILNDDGEPEFVSVDDERVLPTEIDGGPL
jgi:hypothetical protein